MGRPRRHEYIHDLSVEEAAWLKQLVNFTSADRCTASIAPRSTQALIGSPVDACRLCRSAINVSGCTVYHGREGFLRAVAFFAGFNLANGRNAASIAARSILFGSKSRSHPRNSGRRLLAVSEMASRSSA